MSTFIFSTQSIIAHDHGYRCLQTRYHSRAFLDGASFAPLKRAERDQQPDQISLGRTMKIEALCAAPPEALTHSPSQMPLSCPVAPQAARRPLRLRPRGHAPRNTSLRRRTNYLEPQRLRPLRHAPNTSPGCRSCASAPSPAAPAGVREEHYSRSALSARNLSARNRDAAIVRCRCDDALGLPWCCSAHAC